MLGGALKNIFEMLHVDIDRPRGESRLGRQRDADRADWRVWRAHGRALGLLTLLAGGAVLTLGEPVNAVVEKKNLHIDVSADNVHEVVSADGKPVAVAGNQPDVQIGPRQLQPGGECRCATVNAVDAVSVHVIRKSA